MFQRKNAGGSLPTTSPLSVPAGDNFGASNSMGFGNRAPDGSGKAIKMEAPVVKAWKKSSPFTKYSYYFMAFFVLLIIVGVRYLRAWNASIWLTCQSQECTLELTAAGYGTQTLVFSRTQLEGSQAIKTDHAGNFLRVDTSKYEPPPRKGKKKAKSGGSYKGPDDSGEYKSYSVKFYERTPEGVEKSLEDIPDGDFSTISQYLDYEKKEDGNGVYSLHMSRFGFHQSRTRVRSSTSKVDSYIKKRRHKLLLKESASLPWQGLVSLMLGITGFLLTLVIGQFWDSPTAKQTGPGTRRTITRKSNPSFFVDTGRPTKYPAGYKKH